MNNFSPPIEISCHQLPTSKTDVHIIREDLLPGGTKQRAIIPFLHELSSSGYNEYVYASPFCGFAQVALAYAGLNLKKKVKLFCEVIPSQDKKSYYFHDLSLLAQDLGAQLIPCRNLEEAEIQAQLYSQEMPQSFKLPLGFNHPLFLHYYTEALEKQFTILLEKLKFTPEVMWLPVGSGTLAALFRKVLPSEITLKCVNVRVLKPDDQRIESIKNLENVQLFTADMLFHEENKFSPPVPSNKYYDAKLWHFISEHATHNDIWWNVAR